MVSSFGRGFDSLQLHYVSPSRGLTLVRVLSVAALCESGKEYGQKKSPPAREGYGVGVNPTLS